MRLFPLKSLAERRRHVVEPLEEQTPTAGRLGVAQRPRLLVFGWQVLGISRVQSRRLGARPQRRKVHAAQELVLQHRGRMAAGAQAFGLVFDQQLSHEVLKSQKKTIIFSINEENLKKIKKLLKISVKIVLNT